MHGLNNEHKQSINFTLNDGDEVGDGGEEARGGRPHAKALGDRGHHFLQQVDGLGCDVAARSIAVV